MGTSPAGEYRTYRRFPPELYRRFLDRYVSPYAPAPTDCLDLGCGSGGMIQELLSRTPCGVLGVDLSRESLDACRERGLPADRVKLLEAGALDLLAPEWEGRFDLVMSYSVLHLVHADTAAKLRLLRHVTRRGAVVAVDAVPRLAWNSAWISALKLFFRAGLGPVLIRTLGPWVAPNMPKEYIQELSKLDYIGGIEPADFLDLSLLETPEFREAFDVLRLDIVPQDGFFTARKARFALRRK